MLESYWLYFGKAKQPEEGQEIKWHPAVYHCLDVALVAEAWWNASKVIRARISKTLSEHHTLAWLLFFVALHDFGKFDARFQAKVIELFTQWFANSRPPSANDTHSYRHGPAGYAWFVKNKALLLKQEHDLHALQAWTSWLAAVTGHHGQIPTHANDTLTSCRGLPKEDLAARVAWFQALESLFLAPVGLSLKDAPPILDEGSQAFVAGFCSVCDWLGSNDAPGQFEYVADRMPLDIYLARGRAIAIRAIELAQLHQPALASGGFKQTYPDKTPRQVQTLIDSIPSESSLTLIEAPTGSGKTEAALALASRLLADGLAESVIFALPTQATANAMLGRLERTANQLFPGGTNLILAHGKARYNPQFDLLKTLALTPTIQGQESAGNHCAEWLAASRKRAFLGQIGVCTVDQVLLAVLPVRHAFIRGFGLGKSVLIIDEVHAYDSYMLGLLTEVLARQRQAGGSAILLSATLPSAQRDKLLAAWNNEIKPLNTQGDYPLITQAHDTGAAAYYQVDDIHRPSARRVEIDLCTMVDMRPDAGLVERILTAARAGAKVAVVCNLVADAQDLARTLRQLSADIPVDIFHSRYRFLDRQDKEMAVLDHYGSMRPEGGRILVATQVVEQSLDLDFDWLITQLCPMDLLFQRLGRLHRHPRSERPHGFKRPLATVLVPPDYRYGHGQEAVYCKAMLWRTEILLRRQPDIAFPEVYRPYIEQVYDEAPWPDEPETITEALSKHLGEAMAQRSQALQLARSVTNPFEDDDNKIRAFTRSGEQGPQVLLTTADGTAPLFRPELRLSTLQEWELREVLDLECIGVPDSWRGALPAAENNRVVLPMREIEAGCHAAETAKVRFFYDPDLGLRKIPAGAGNVP